MTEPANPGLTRRRLLALLGAAAAGPALSACGDQAGPADTGVRVGFVVPRSGAYSSLGTDMARGWALRVEQNGGTLGGRAVQTLPVDEGETTEAGVAAVRALLAADGADVLVGMVNSATALGVADLLEEYRTLLVVANAGAAGVTGAGRGPYSWRTSFTNVQAGVAMGTHLAEADLAGVYAIAPDHVAGTEIIGGFTGALQAGGGTIAGEARPTPGADHGPFLAAIEQSGAEATFCSFSGADAVRFVRRYVESGLAETVPLYGSGQLTEAGALAELGATALGVRTTLHYSDQLDTPANAAFVAAYSAAYGSAPSCYSVQGYDAAGVLDRALATTTSFDGPALADALEGLGPVDDSPRGAWTFDGRSPRQNVYLREVRDVGGTMVNSVVRDLGPHGPT